MRRMRVTSCLILIAGVGAGAYGVYAYLGGDGLSMFRQSALGQKISPEPHERGEDETGAHDAHSVAQNEPHGPQPEAGHRRTETAPVREAAVTAHGVLSRGGVCSSFEYFVPGSRVQSPSAGDWAVVMKLYHGAKAGLLAWTEENRWRIPDPALQQMERAVKEVRIHRPPSHEEPELAYRGVGVLSEDLEGKPMIRVGAGFVRLARENPSRAKFELTRMIAQTWAPCSLEKHKVEHPWTALLGCVGVDAGAKCSGSPYSEAGWAVSSVIAARIAPPGCDLPALAGPDKAACVSKMPLPLTVKIEDGTREARR